MPTTPPPILGHLFMWPGQLFYIGYGTAATEHAHHALQLMIALDHDFELRVGGARQFERHQLVLVGSDVAHEFREAQPGRVALLYIDPDGRDGRRLRTLVPRLGVLPIESSQAAALGIPVLRDETTWTDTRARAWTGAALAALLGGAGPAEPQHPGVRRALAFLEARVEQRTLLAEVAAAAQLSSGRLVHVFRDQVGLPIRRYCLWLRLQRAAKYALGGRDLTDAAHAAGFADSAHLTRTFRRMFGLTPSLVVANSQFIQAH